MVLVQGFIFFVLVCCGHHVRANSSEEKEIMTKCLEEASVKIEDIKTFRTDQITDKMMCFMKCKYENEGVFDGKGVLTKEIMQESYDDFGWTDKQKSQVDNCLDNMKPVKECSDLEPFFSCIPVINFSEFFE